jgi:glucosamine--fructose-6-phosphate aminotransferase (isomerizing)
MPDYDPNAGYLRDILQQPAALEATRQQLEGGLALNNLPERLAAGEFRRLILTGMGSSFHALTPLFYALAGQGRPALMVETGELIHHAAGLLDGGSLVIAVSQSGRSAEIVRLLEQAARRGTPVLGVTNTPGSPLAKLSAAHLLTAAGEEATVSCKTYVTSLLALAWLADALTGSSLEGTRRASQAAAPAVQTYLSGWRRHTTALEKALDGIEQIFLAGRGSSLAACGTGGLITKESAHVHAEGMSSAALRHGPLEMLDATSFVLVFAGNALTRELNAKLYEEIRGMGIPAGWVDMAHGDGPFALPVEDESLRPVLEILPIEMMTLALAHLRGRTAGTFERAAKVTTVE